MARLFSACISATPARALLLLIVLSGPGAVTVNAQPADDTAPRKPVIMKGPKNAENLMTGETTEDPLRTPLHVAPGDTITISFGRKTGTWTYVFPGNEPRPLEFSARLASRQGELLIHRPGGEELIGLKIWLFRRICG